MRVFFEARCCGRRLEGNTVTRGHGLPCQPQNGESLPPQPLRPTSESQCPVPWASHLPPLGSPWKAPLSAPAGPRVEAVGGERGSPASRRTGERLITPSSPGMPGSQRPMSQPRTSRVCSPLPSGTSLPTTSRSPGERLWLLSRRAGSWIPRERLEQPQRPGGRICQADGNCEGTRCF